MSTAVWVGAAVTALVAGYVQGLTGLGFAIVFTPVLVLLVPHPRDVVVASLLLGTVLGVGVLADSRKAFRPRRAWPLLVGAAVGTPAGVALLPHLPRAGLTVLIAGTALALATVWVVRAPNPVRHETAAVTIAGLLGVDTGFLLRSLWLLPAAVAGTLLGGWSVRRVSTRAFRYALVGVVWLAGLLALVSVLTG